MISRKAYYYLALFFPFLVRAFAVPHFFGGNIIEIGDDTWLMPRMALEPYGLFVLICWIYFYRMKASDIRIALIFSPAVFAVFVFAFFLIVFTVGKIINGGGDPLSAAVNAGLWVGTFSAMLGLGLGFMYVCSALIIEWILIQCRLIQPQAAS